jgi:hypothetical protein
MGLLFNDALYDAFGTWALGYIPYGGADFGEVHAVARSIGAGDDAVFHKVWIDFRDRLGERAQEQVARPPDAPWVTAALF